MGYPCPQRNKASDAPAGPQQGVCLHAALAHLAKAPHPRGAPCLHRWHSGPAVCLPSASTFRCDGCHALARLVLRAMTMRRARAGILQQGPAAAKARVKTFA